MPQIVAPNLIEQTDFSSGVATVPEAAHLPMEVLTDVSNLLPDVGGSGALETRVGFERVISAITGTHYIKQMFRFRGNGTTYLILVLTNEAAAANNVRVYALNLATNTATRIDTPGRTWANPTADHVMVGVQEVLYGSSPGNDWYSWDPSTSTWDADAATGSWDTLVDSITPGAGEKARDFAFTGREKIVYGGDVFTPARGIRFDKWEDDQRYEKGQRVSRKTAISGQTYWRSYRCTKAHDSSDTTAAPGTGANWRTYWQRVRLPLPKNDDGETSEKWYFVPVPQGTNVAAWYADRLWVRGDHVTGKDNLLFSAPLKPDKGSDVGDVVWRLTDFAPGNDEKGPGGGWIPFNDGRSSGVIEAIRPMQNGLLVFKRQAVWILTGRSDASFAPRRLADDAGCVAPRALTELDGLVYFLSDDGLRVTDGTAVERVQNSHYVDKDIEARIDLMSASGNFGRNPRVFEYEGRIWISMPAENGTPQHLVYVYDPRYASWWKLNIPILDAAVQRYQGVPVMYLSAPDTYGSGTQDVVYQYTGTTDDNGQASGTQVDIAWFLQTSWWSFGVVREERRVRRMWATLKGPAQTYTITAYRNFASAATKTTNRASTVTDAQYIEGEWFADAYAVRYKVAGTKASSAVYGVAVDTQPRRHRYHRGAGA